MDESLTKIEKEDLKLSSRSYLGNFNESEFAPILATSDNPPIKFSRNPLDSPNLPFSSNLATKPLFRPFQSPKMRKSHPYPNKFASKQFLRISENDFSCPPRSQFQGKIGNTRKILKEIIRSFGVQFYLSVLEEYQQDHGFLKNNSFYEGFKPQFQSGEFTLSKRQSPNFINKNLLSNLKNKKFTPINNSFQIQKINSDSTKNDSLFSILNGNLQCPNPFGEKQEIQQDSLRVTSIEKFESEINNPKNILLRLYNIICGDSPKENWTLNWDPRQIQIFWLLLFKMGVLPEDWQTSLQRSNCFPNSSRKLKNVSHKTNMLTNRILIKILNKYFYQARDKNCKISETVLKKLLKSGKNTLIKKDFIHFSKIVGLSGNSEDKKKYIDISKIQNQYLNRKMKDVLCEVLSKESKTNLYYIQVRSEVLNKKNEFQNYHKNKVFKKLRMAISKVETFLAEGGELPKIGLEMNSKQKTVFKKLKIPPPLQNWIDAFLQVDNLLSLIPSVN